MSRCPGVAWLGRVPVILALLCAGCFKVGPDFAQPDSPVTPQWMEAGDTRVKAGTQIEEKWWQAFKDPVLDRLVDAAYRNNLTLQIAGVRVLQARAYLGVVTGNLYPQSQSINGAFEFNRGSQNAPDMAMADAVENALGIPASDAGATFMQDQLGVQASWEADLWGKYRRAIESADAELLSSLADYDDVLVSLLADVAGTYISIRTLEERVDIARANTVVEKESLGIAEARFHGGATTLRDVEQAKTILASTEATVPYLEAQLRQAKNALCILLGMPPREIEDLLSGKGDIPTPPPEIVVGIPADLLRRRPDIRSAGLMALSKCSQIGVAKAELYPSLTLTGSFGVLSSDVGSFSLADTFDWSSVAGQVGPAVQWNFFNYGRIMNNVRFQDAQFQELLLAYQNTVLTAQREVEDSLVGYLRGHEQSAFLKESARAAEGSVRLAVLQYREGIADFTTVLTAQQSLLKQQDDWASSVGSVAGYLVSLYRALGGGWQIRETNGIVPQQIQQVMEKRTDWGRLMKDTTSEAAAPEERGVTSIRTPDW